MLTLDSIRAAAEAKYGSTDIDLGDGQIVRLLNPLRLPKERRDALMAAQDKLNGDDADQAAVLTETLTLVAETPKQAEALLSAVGDDLGVLAAIMEEYGAKTQVGEASASAS